MVVKIDYEQLLDLEVDYSQRLKDSAVLSAVSWEVDKSNPHYDVLLIDGVESTPVLDLAGQIMDKDWTTVRVGCSFMLKKGFIKNVKEIVQQFYEKGYLYKLSQGCDVPTRNFIEEKRPTTNSD